MRQLLPEGQRKISDILCHGLMRVTNKAGKVFPALYVTLNRRFWLWKKVFTKDSWYLRW